MEPEATLQPEATGTAAGAVEEQIQATQPEERKMVPMPADKLRELHQAKRERDQMLEERNQRNLPTTSSTTLTKEAEEALELIGDRATRKIAPELSAVRDELDTNRVEQFLLNVENDPKADPWRDELVPALKDLIKENPGKRTGELLEQAKREAIYRSFNSGKLSQQAADEAEERVLTKSRAGGSAAKSAASTGRGTTEKSIEDMTEEELAADPKAFDELYAKTQGRKPRG